MRISPYPELIRTPYPEPYPVNSRCLIRTPYPACRPACRPAGRQAGRPAGLPAGRPVGLPACRPACRPAAAGLPAGFGGPGAGPGPPPGDGHRHWKIVTGKSYLKTFGMVRGSFWPKLVKSSCFKPNGRHEQLRSTFFIGKSSGISSKALTRVRFVTDRWHAKS